MLSSLYFSSPSLISSFFLCIMSKFRAMFHLISTSYTLAAFLPSRLNSNGAFTKRQYLLNRFNSHSNFDFCRHGYDIIQTICKMTSSSGGGDNNDNDDNGRKTLSMENIYTEWSIEDDKILYDNFNQPIHKVAAILGRGLNGVAARKKKMSDVESPVYQRLFVKEKVKIRKLDEKGGLLVLQEEEEKEDAKLVPVMEVLRRIKWDQALDSIDFTVQYYDRVQEKYFECPFSQKNESVKGKEELFVFAIPEHRIAAIKFRERIVWDKESRLDCVFGSMNGNGETINEVIETYSQWEMDEREKKEFNKRRQIELASQLRLILGDALFSALKEISQSLQEKANISKISDQDVTNYVSSAMSLFRRAELPIHEDGSKVIDEIEALNTFSDLVALLPNEVLREDVLLHIHQLITKLEYDKAPKNQARPLPELNEDELDESFVRGSGAGGQKINKTSNKVVLLHIPTQIRVECQDTRSLQQNRKIARKRMQLKLDQYCNGVSSRTEMKLAEKIQKKAKTKARNKARQRKKREAAGANED